MTPIVGRPRTIILAVLGAIVGAVLGHGLRVDWPWRAGESWPAPYALGRTPDAAVLHLAMVHDVLHERYLRHGPAWYERRLARATAAMAPGDAAIAAGGEPDDAWFDAADDRAVALERLGRPEEAIPLMREKLAHAAPVPSESDAAATGAAAPVAAARGDRPRWSYEFAPIDAVEAERIQHADRSVAGRRRYRGWANLGTVLVHAAMPAALRGDAAARARVEEGLHALRLAMRIDPGAHFGREIWQAVAVEHLLAAARDASVARRWSLVGDPLGELPQRGGMLGVYGVLFPLEWDAIERGDVDLVRRARIRSALTRVGIDEDWATAVHAEETMPAPFDEPTLALIGMWTLGGGANPHSALALAHIMERIGQREIAWEGYERAIELRERWWPDAAVTEVLVRYARDRQALIARAESPADPVGWQDRVRARHRAELAWGEAYQRDYQAFEADAIAAGRDIDAPGAYDAFFSARPPIASPVGREDRLVFARRRGDGRDVAVLAAIGCASSAVLAMLTDAGSRARAAAREQQAHARRRRGRLGGDPPPAAA